MSEKNIDLPKLPQISKKEIKKIATTFKSLKNEEGKSLLTASQAEALSEIRLKNGDLLFDENWFIYEVVAMINKFGYQPVYDFLTANEIYDRKKLLFDSPIMDKQKEKFLVDMENFRDKPDAVTGGEKCPRCQSDSTISVEQQTRSADEPMTIKITCLQCRFRWTAQ